MIYGRSAKRLGHKSTGKNSTDRENAVSKIFIISLRLIRRAGKETSHNQAEGSTATKIAVPKFQKPIFLAVKFEIVACKIQQFSVQVYATEMA